MTRAQFIVVFIIHFAIAIATFAVAIHLGLTR